MSCSKCGSVNTSCGCKDTAYTTPKVYTCPPDTSCPQPVRCSEFMDAACIFLNDGIADAGIQPGSSLESIVQQLILLVTNPGCVDAPGGVPGGGTVNFVDAVWPGNAIIIAGGPIQNSGTFVFNGQGTSLQYIDGQGNLQTFPSIPQPIEFQTNGTPNSVQNLLNLVAGAGVTLTESNGSVTIDVEGNIYTVDNGLSADPTDPNNFQLGSATSPGAPLIHDTYIAGAQYRFEINNTNSMFLQGNRVDIEGAASGAKVLSTGGASDNSLEVTGTQVALESVGSGATRIFLDPAKIRIQTPLYNTKNNNDVLTLIDKTTGEVEFMPVTGILLQVDGVDNADQALLNLVSGNGITITNSGGDVTIDGPTFQTNGTDNSVQNLLNLVAGTGITLTESGGSVTIDADAPAINLTTNLTGGGATYNAGTGDLNIPIYQSQIDFQEEGSSVVVNPLFVNFIGDAVTLTSAAGGTGVDVTITGGTPYVVANGLHAFGDAPGESPADPYLFHLGGTLVENTEINLDTAYTLDVLATTGKKMLHLESGNAKIGDIDGINISGLWTYADIGSSFKVRYNGTSRGLDIDPIGYWAMGDLDNINLGTKIEIKDLGQDITMSGQVGTAYDKRGFYLTYGGSIQIAIGDLDNSLNQTYYVLDDFSETHSLTKRLQFVNYNNSTAYQSWITDGTTYNAGPSVGVLNVDNAGNVFVASGTALTLQVDGSPFSSSSLLNFTTSADIGVTDLGGGAVSFSLATPIVAYDSNEGVWNESDVFKLGAPSRALSISDIPFTQDRFVYTNVSGLIFEGAGADDHIGVVQITNTGSNGVALNVHQTEDGTGVFITQDSDSNRGMKVSAVNATNSFGAVIEDASGNDNYTGIKIQSQSTNTLPLFIDRTPGGSATPNTIETFMLLQTGRGTVANGIGGSIDFKIQSSTGFQYSNKLITSWFDSTNASRKSQFEIQGTNSSTVESQFTILGGGTSGSWALSSGQIKFNKYATGAIYKSADDLVAASGFNLGIDADGNIWATDFSTSTGPVTGVSSISIGTLTNGASATVSNPSGPAASINITGQNAYTQIAADTGTASANAFNSQFNVIGANGVSTSVTNGTMPTADVITVTGPNKYLNFVTKNISGGTIATYTPTTWNETLNIQAGSGITITNGGSPNTLVISGGAGTGTVSNVTGVNGNGFTVGVTNGTTTPAITVGTSITGVLVGNGTSVSAVTGTGVMVFSGTGYTFQPLPTVNNGAIIVGATADLVPTNTTVALQLSAGSAFTANTATDSTYRVAVGPALKDYALKMTGAVPVGSLPLYLTKTAQDTATLATPVTTFSPGTTGFTISNGITSGVTTPLNGPVVLSGVLSVTSGGTGNTTAPGNGQVLVGDGSGGFTVTNISGSGAVSVTSGPGGIVITGTGVTPSVVNGLHTHATDGSIRLGSGNVADGDIIRPLIEKTDIRLNNQFYRLSNNNNGYITEVGFQIDDTTGQKIGFFGSSASTVVTTANTPGVGFVFSGFGGTALTTYNGQYIDNTTAETKVYSGFSSNVRQVITRSGTAANNKITQVGTWGATADQTFYEAIPSARTIQIGSTGGNNNWIKLDDANQRVDINKSIIYGSAYGTGAVTGASLAALIAVDPTGKFYEFAGRSISNITGNTGTFTAASMASATAPVTFSIQGSGTISTSITGNVLTISSSATGFPYWSTIALTAAAGSSGSVVGDANVVPNVVGANTLNLIAGNNITFTAADASNRIQIEAVVPTASNSWGNITFSGNSTGTNLVLQPDAILDPLGIVAGAGIAIAVTGGGAGSTADSFTITNSGVLSLVTGTTDAFSVVNSSGNYTVNIPYRWRGISVTNGGAVGAGTTLMQPTIAADTLNFNAGPGIQLNTDPLTKTLSITATGAASNAWYNIAAVNGAVAGAAAGPLVPDITQDTLTFAGGTGISVTLSDIAGALDRVVITNTGITSITTGTNSGVSVSTVGGVTTISGTYTSNNGVYKTPSNVFQLGAPSGSQNTIPFTEDRYIDGVTFKLDMTSAMTAGRGVLHLTSTNVGRALRAVNTTVTGSTPEGSIYAESNQPTSTDTAPTGTIYSTTNANLGSSIVGVGTATSSEDSRPAIFGKGYIAVKGYNTTGQVQSVSGYVTGGVGVYGASVYAAPVTPGSASSSVWGVVGSTVSNTNMLLTWASNTGTGVYGEATGGLRGGTYGTNTDLTTFAGRFVINPSGQGALPSTGTSVGIRAMNNVGDVLQIVRLTNNNSNYGIGGSIVFNIEGATNTGYTDGWKAGRVGYKMEDTVEGPTRFFVTTVSASSGERETLAVDSNGQVAFAEYATTGTVANQGEFPPTTEIITGYTGYFDYSVPAARSKVTLADETIGRLDTLRTRHGEYNPATVVVGAITGYGTLPAGLTFTVSKAYFTSLNNIVTVHITGTFSLSTAGSKTVNFPLPVASSATTMSNVIKTFTFNTFNSYAAFGTNNITYGDTGSNQRMSITIPSIPTGVTHDFSLILTYKAY